MTMTYTEQAIQKAIEGGYWPSNREKVSPVRIDMMRSNLSFALNSEGGFVCSSLFLDPLFWQSLGKSLGWKIHKTFYHFSSKGLRSEINPKPEWKRRWHRFIDHLAEGKDAESFFESLINVKG